MTIDSVPSAYISRPLSSEISTEESVISKETIKAILSLGIPGNAQKTGESQNIEETAIDTFA